MENANQQYPIIEGNVPVIERNVPIPKGGQRAHRTDLDWVKTMQPGDSVVVDYKTSCAIMHRGKLLGFKMTQRKLEADKSFKESDARVWRIQ